MRNYLLILILALAAPFALADHHEPAEPVVSVEVADPVSVETVAEVADEGGISIDAESAADVVNKWLPALEGTSIGGQITKILLFLASIIGLLSVLGTVITAVSGITENTKDDRFANGFKKFVSWLQVFISKLALNGGTGRRPK